MMIDKIKKQLDAQLQYFNPQDFVSHDPIQVPKKMAARPGVCVQDIEICAIWTATITWGKRELIIKAAKKLMERCNWHPYQYILTGAFLNDILKDETIYRTLKGEAFIEICYRLHHFYKKNVSFRMALQNYQDPTIYDLLETLCNILAPAHLGHPQRNSACKRINMLLRWMIRKDDIDFGIWQTKNITPAGLYAIMDTHVAQQATKMGLLSHPKESWKAVQELTAIYRYWDAEDPLKYDFILMSNNLQQ